MHPGQGCQLGGRFSRCERPAAHTCQYCGRAFCELHTYHAEAHDEVCLRKRCAAKHDDLIAHMRYKQRVAERNQVGLCGIEDCGPHPGFECSLCHGHFCATHLSERMYPFTEGWVTIDRPVSICLSCWERRKIWRRR
jgi:hypothetical protein